MTTLDVQRIQRRDLILDTLEETIKDLMDNEGLSFEEALEGILEETKAQLEDRK